MRLRRTAALAGVALLYLALGPLVLLGGAALLAVPRVRAWLRPTRRVVGAWLLALTVLAGLVLLVPDARLPVPPGGGLLTTASYDGRPVASAPVHLGRGAAPGLAAASTTGPRGESPSVDSAWLGREQCRDLTLDSRERLVALCEDRRGPRLRVVDPTDLRLLAAKDLPGRPDDADPPCGPSLVLDDRDRALIASADRRVRVVETADAEGEPDLTTREVHDLRDVVAADDCLVSVVPDRAGRLWFVTRAGRVGTVGGSTLDLGEEVGEVLTAGPGGAVYAVTAGAVVRLGLDRAGAPEVVWRTEYDGGSEPGDGTPVAVLSGGRLAVADAASPRAHVVVLDARDGDAVCDLAVFEDDRSAAGARLVPVGRSSVVVQNTAGGAGPWRTLLGRTPPGGLARVDVRGGDCSLAWTSALVAPSAPVVLAPATGLLYAATKRPSRWGVDAWYLTALDPRTGRTAWSVRTGLGALAGDRGAALVVGPGAAAVVATPSGLVRVHDRD